MAYRWEYKLKEEPGKAPVVQAYIVPTEETAQRTQREQQAYMRELKEKGYIDLPPELAAKTGFNRWVPSDQTQTAAVLREMTSPEGDTGKGG